MLRSMRLCSQMSPIMKARPTSVMPVVLSGLALSNSCSGANRMKNVNAPSTTANALKVLLPTHFCWLLLG